MKGNNIQHQNRGDTRMRWYITYMVIEKDLCERSSSIRTVVIHPEKNV